MIKKPILALILSTLTLGLWAQASGYKGKTQYVDYALEIGHQNSLLGMTFESYAGDRFSMRWPTTHMIQYHKMINRVNEVTIGLGYGRNTQDSTDQAKYLYTMFNQMESSVSTKFVQFQDIRLSLGYRKYMSGSQHVSLAPLHLYMEGRIDFVRVKEIVTTRNWRPLGAGTISSTYYHYEGSSIYITPVFEWGYQTVLRDNIITSMGLCLRAPLRLTKSPYPEDVLSTRDRSSVYIWHAYPEFIKAKFSIGYLF